jgi:hypothetical protein
MSAPVPVKINPVPEKATPSPIIDKTKVEDKTKSSEIPAPSPATEKTTKE